ncbi:ATP-binding cassette domain-containing protein [Thiomicrospira sp. WB1]|uniref:ATP-binding cassette domain-containing protein n=1 Tax=Thiomicrospira sp. WB1 TaxID=1685380 RepID=UPI0007494A4B|nr:ATP-binding cassette domain-containing protein [Thiomicrospira sp. WB1]KUJ72402.1 methionine ABC transporter ATP-binding protein [Thiomicrospira sp. WB1]
MSFAFELNDLRFGWQKGRPDVLHIDRLALPKGEHLFIQGASGSGKSTLLNLLSGVLLPSSGKIYVLDQDMQGLSATQRDRFRADRLGIIFQQFNLLPFLSPIQNAQLPLTFSPKRKKNCAHPDTRIASLLQQLNLPKPLWHQPASQLSLGQQQRIAIARALIGDPDLIIADEPTSALDAGHRDRFMQCLFDTAQNGHTSIVFVSHDPTLAHYFQHQFRLPDPAETATGDDT